MGLAGFSPDIIKPTALALNVLVSAIGCIRFYRLGLLTWRDAAKTSGSGDNGTAALTRIANKPKP
jgi:uncharacterized membrane protein YfcA